MYEIITGVLLAACYLFVVRVRTKMHRRITLIERKVDGQASDRLFRHYWTPQFTVTAAAVAPSAAVAAVLAVFERREGGTRAVNEALEGLGVGGSVDRRPGASGRPRPWSVEFVRWAAKPTEGGSPTRNTLTVSRNDEAEYTAMSGDAGLFQDHRLTPTELLVAVVEWSNGSWLQVTYPEV